MYSVRIVSNLNFSLILTLWLAYFIYTEGELICRVSILVLEVVEKGKPLTGIRRKELR